MQKLLLVLLGLLLLPTIVASKPVRAEAAELRPSWVLEFGPYVGYYDFDALSRLEDFGLFGARIGAHVNHWLRVEGEFDEVYTERKGTGNRARQVTFGLHARIEPFDWTLAPMVLAGIAFVAFDDQDDPDAYGDALDLGLGARYRWRPQWTLRAEWLLRRQSFQLFRRVEGEEGESLLGEDAVTLWGRGFRVGVAYVF